MSLSVDLTVDQLERLGEFIAKRHLIV